MQTKLYSQVSVLHVYHGQSGRIKAVIFYDIFKHSPSGIVERMFNGCRWVFLCDPSPALSEIHGHIKIHHRGHVYRAYCTNDVIGQLQAHKGRHYVYICA